MIDLHTRAKKSLEVLPSRLSFNLAVPTFPVRYQTSIIGVVDLTSVFGMGTGVSLQLCPPEIFHVLRQNFCLVDEIFVK